MIVALLRFYDYNEEHFVFGDTKVDLGLEDVMYITGLPIDGKQISAFEPGDPIETIVNHLSLHPVEANDLLLPNKRGKKSHNISLKRLKEKFQSIDVTEENVNSYVKAYILFLLGNVLFTTSSTFTDVSVIYLPFLEVLDIDNYAWGAAVHATLKASMNKVRQGNKTLTGFAYLLMEGDVDERETESPPRCNLPTPRDEVQAPSLTLLYRMKPYPSRRLRKSYPPRCLHSLRCNMSASAAPTGLRFY
ncbi:hypothetical protein RYX36_016271 [Vicia faba]